LVQLWTLYKYMWMGCVSEANEARLFDGDGLATFNAWPGNTFYLSFVQCGDVLKRRRHDGNDGVDFGAWPGSFFYQISVLFPLKRKHKGTMETTSVRRSNSCTTWHLEG
jgi:hypothetical protein